jgi:hypothetical protein
VKICTEVPGSNPGPVKRELFGPHGTPELQTMNLRHQESDTSPWLEFGPRGTPELQTPDKCLWLSRFKLIRLRRISLATLRRDGWRDGQRDGIKGWFHQYKRYVQ